MLTIYQAGLDGGEASFETRAPAWEVFDATRLAGHLATSRLTTPAARCWAGPPPSAASFGPVRVPGGGRALGVRRPGGARARVGAALLGALISSTEAAGIWTIQSGIFPENAASLRLHEQLGFRVVGVRERLGRLDSHWRDVVLLERRSPRVGD